MKKSVCNTSSKDLRIELRKIINGKASKEEILAFEKNVLFKIKHAPMQSHSTKVIYAELMSFLGNYSRSNYYYYRALEEIPEAHWIYYYISKNNVKMNKLPEALGYLKTLDKAISRNNGKCDLNVLIDLLTSAIYGEKIELKYYDDMFNKYYLGTDVLYNYQKIVNMLNKGDYTEVLLFIDKLKKDKDNQNIISDLEFIESIVLNIIERRNYDDKNGLTDAYCKLDYLMKREKYEDVISIIKYILYRDKTPKMCVFKYIYSLICLGYANEFKNFFNNFNRENNMNLISHLKNVIGDLKDDCTNEEYTVLFQKAIDDKEYEIALKYAIEGYEITGNNYYAFLAGSLALEMERYLDAEEYLKKAIKHNGRNYSKILKKFYILKSRIGDFDGAIKYFDQYSRTEVIYNNYEVLSPVFSKRNEGKNRVDLINDDLYRQVADYYKNGFVELAEELIKSLENKKEKTVGDKLTLKKINNNKKLLLMQSKKAEE